jgi:hypothetical protein
MDPDKYALIEPTTPFVLVADPGDFPVYNKFATKAAIKMTDKRFEHDKNYYLSFININQVCFCMLNDNFADQIKVSNTANMMGWNSSVSICLIIEQLETLYGKPNTMSLFHNGALFRNPLPTTNASEMLFYQIEQRQEIQTIAQDLYTPKQTFGNTVRLLMQLGIFPLKELDTWEAVPIKSYPILKMLIHEAYFRCLMAIQMQNTVGQQGYVQQNIYNILNKDKDNNTNDTITVIT